MIEQNEQRERWHLKKEIQITHVFTTLTLVGAVFAYVQKVDQRLTIVETQLVAQREASVIQRAQLERMDAKLDRLMERSK
jgi:hypothetical protein